MFRTTWRLVVAATLALGLLGGLVTPSSASAGSALVRIVHASPGAPQIEAFVDGQKFVTAPAFATATPYTTVPAGAHDIGVFTVGAGPAGKAFFNARVDLQEGRAYTLVAADVAAKMEPVLLNDELTTVVPGQAYVRLFHASPDAPAIADVAVLGGPVIFRGVAFKSAAGYRPIAAGSYSFEVRPAGTDLPLATTNAIELAAGRIYTVFAIGQLSDNTFQVVILPDNAQSGGIGGVPSTGAGGMSRAQPGRMHPTLDWYLTGGVLVLLLIARPWRSRIGR